MTEPTSKPTPRWIKVLLVASLALNLLILGAVFGVMITRDPDRRAALPRDLASAVYFGALPREHRQALAEALRAETSDPAAERAALRAELEAVLELLRATPLDTEALGAAIFSQRIRLAERTARGDRLFLAQLAEMDADDLQTYADRIERMLERGLRHER